MVQLIIGAGYLLVYVLAGWALRGHPVALSVFGNFGLVSTALLVVVVVARQRHRWMGCQRLFWDTFAIGMILWTVGHLGWAYRELFDRHSSWVEWHTVFSLCGGFGPLVALIARPQRGVRRHAVATAAVDIASWGLVIGFLYAFFVLLPSVAAQVDSQKALLVVVQAFRLLLTVGMVAAAFAAFRTAWGPVYVKLAAGTIVGFFLRLATSQAIDNGTYHLGSFYDLAWIAPFLTYAWAAQSSPSSPDEVEDVEEHGSTLDFALFSAAPVLLIPVVGYTALRLYPLGTAPDSLRSVLTGLATVAGLGLVTLRLVVQRSELQRVDARLRLFAAATEQAGELILITRADGAFELANDAFLRTLGYSRREMRLHRFPQPVDHGFEHLAEEIPAEIASHGIWRGTLQRRRKDGSTFPAASTVVALKDRTGKVTHFVLVERDVTDELRIRDQIVHSERLSAIGELVAGVAHEMNNPLQTIVGCVELMLDERTAGVVERRDLELVSREAARAGHIVRNLLSFVRRTTPDRVAADLTQIVRSTIQLREYQLDLQGIALEQEYSGEPLPVFVNREEIQQIVLNLVLNAEHALASTGRSGRIRVRTAHAGGGQVVDVADNGPGITPQLRGRIFEPFFTTKDVGEGTGLGLSISHGIAAAHHGSLDLLDIGEGACFRLSLPAHSPVQAAAQSRSSAEPVARRDALVVDDEEPIRKLLTRLLERRGFAVRAAETGETAIDLASEIPPGLVFCDMRMPGMSGVDLFRRLRAGDSQIGQRFIFITGDAASVHESHPDIGDAAVLPKPFTAADLDAVLQRFGVDPRVPS